MATPSDQNDPNDLYDASKLHDYMGDRNWLPRDTCWTSRPRAHTSVVIKHAKLPRLKFVHDSVTFLFAAFHHAWPRDSEIGCTHLSVSQSTFTLLYPKITAWIVKVSYKSQRVSNFHSFFHGNEELFNPSRVNSSRLNQNFDGIGHEFGGNVEDFSRRLHQPGRFGFAGVNDG